MPRGQKAQPITSRSAARKPATRKPVDSTALVSARTRFQGQIVREILSARVWKIKSVEERSDGIYAITTDDKALRIETIRPQTA